MYLPLDLVSLVVDHKEIRLDPSTEHRADLLQRLQSSEHISDARQELICGTHELERPVSYEEHRPARLSL
jgi:hypothetical protein